MSLVLPSELVVDHFLPTFRAMLAGELADRGLTQQEIANHLGVTQAAVSKYVSERDAGRTAETDSVSHDTDSKSSPGTKSTDNRFRTDPETRETVSHIAEGLAEGTMTQYDALGAIITLIHRLEDRGPICELHEELMPELRGLGCDLCVRGPDTEIRTERETLSTVRKAARTFAANPLLATYVPNVGTNVGMTLPTPTDITDVAAIPGRIYTVSGRIEVPANPEFGASRHVATTLLAANEIDPTIRGAVNIATDDILLETARESEIDTLEFDPDYENRREHLESRFEAHGGVPPVTYHRGAFGIEPTTYVFGRTAVEAVTLAVDLVSAIETE